jgi:hypothetical protein
MQFFWGLAGLGIGGYAGYALGSFLTWAKTVKHFVEIGDLEAAEEISMERYV